MKAKSIFVLILFSVFTFGLTSLAISKGTNISNNGFEDSFPKTAGGYVVWQGYDGIDFEIFLYNANDGSGLQITDNTYGDVNPETDGRYVTWQAGAVQHGEIFLYDIETQVTTRITDDVLNDHSPKIVDGMVVWVSHSAGVGDTLIGPGDIWLYNTADGYSENISKLVDPNNDHNDYGFIFDGNRIQWAQRTSGDMPNYVYDPETMSWIPTNNSDWSNYVYDLATEMIYRYYNPEDDGDDIIPYLVEVVYDPIAGTTGTFYQTTEIPGAQVDPQSDGDFSVSASLIGGSDREILVSDRQFKKRGGRITANSIEDTQPAIKDNIVVWKGGEGNNSEIYLYKIQPLFADAGHDIKMDFANVNQMVIRGKAGGGANQYRWLLDGKELTAGWLELTEWLPVVDGQAPLTLADKSGFVYGPQTLTLEVTDGTTYANDKVIMDLIAPQPLTLISPADGSEFNIRELPVFAWESKGYIQFKIQFSNEASFEAEYIRTFPQSDDTWLYETSFTLEKWQAGQLIWRSKGPHPLYWRVLAQDRYGNEKISQTRRVFFSPGKFWLGTGLGMRKYQRNLCNK